ncbi:hypothetical protein AB0M36_06605 [Actinoplanes sp. NPDC051346]|uniref:hypothetical protein n=1 Tax=Actinoplanes sp. NPDC051346 TaxID=3155048 RepID=UPI003413AB70
MRKPIALRAALGLALVALLAAATWWMAGRSNSQRPTAARVPPSGAPAPVAPVTPSARPPSASAPNPRPSVSVSSTTTARPKASSAPRARAGFPNAGTTGVPAGVTLKAATTTSLRIRKAGTVIDRADIRGEISVEANNVTIKNSRVVNAGNWGIVQRPEVSGLVVKDSEIRGNGKDRLQYAILNLGSGDISILRNDISGVSDALSTNVGLIEGNYLHDPVYFDGDHTDMIQSNSGPPAGQRLVIRHNTVVNTLEQTAAIALFQDFGVQHDATIEHNLLAGGGYALYAGAGKLGTSYNIRVIGNVFSREVFAKSGQYGAVAYWDSGGSGNVWQDNVWADTGRPVTAD